MKLKFFLESQGITMAEFKEMDVKQQNKLKNKHKRALQKEQYMEHVKRVEEANEKKFFEVFLPMKHVNPDTFDSLADWKKEEWRKQFNKYIKEEEIIKEISKKSKREIEDEYIIEYFLECGIPIYLDGSPS